jgi:hypothetical protein
MYPAAKLRKPVANKAGKAYTMLDNIKKEDRIGTTG